MKTNKGSIFARGNRLYFKLKRADGTWFNAASGFAVDQRVQAEAALKYALQRLEVEVEAGVDASGRVTVRSYGEKWLERRKKQTRSWKTTRGHMAKHIFPMLGHIVLEELSTRDVLLLVERLRFGDGKRAPKTVYNVYATLSALCRDARIAGLMQQSPCILTEHQLGEKRDADPAWRRGAQFTRSELHLILTDPRISDDRRVAWALAGLAGCRHGELAGLRWGDVYWDSQPLPHLFIHTSYDSGRTKTDDPRHIPMHPALFAILRPWWEGGWERAMGRAPQLDDLVCPQPPTSRTSEPAMRIPQRTLKLFHQDLDLLGLDRRRVHDLRRTFITLLREDGADPGILRRVTHKAPREVLEDYTSVSFEVLCREVLKLRFGAVLGAAEPQKHETPGNHGASGGFSQRGVRDLKRYRVTSAGPG